MATTKIDTHQHYFPPAYIKNVGLDALARQTADGKAPDWSPEAAIRMMDANGIAEGILSVSSGPTISNAAEVLRQCNEYGAELGPRHPGRFGLFASLPLPDVDASLREAAYCLDELKADGLIVFASYDGHYLGDGLFDPLWEELDRRAAVVFIHPNQPPYVLASIAPASVVEFPFETTRAACSLILSGAMSKYRNIKFILSHAGGTLPYLRPRITLCISMIPGAAERVGDPAAAFRSFYYDTALSGAALPLAGLADITTPDHILFGSDFPMAPLRAIEDFGAELERLPLEGLSKSAIYRTNAEKLFGRTT